MNKIIDFIPHLKDKDTGSLPIACQMCICNQTYKDFKKRSCSDCDSAFKKYSNDFSARKRRDANL